MRSYCYVGRFNHDKVYFNQNLQDIFDSMDRWVEDKPWPKVPNQVDPKYYTMDIGCSTDVPLMSKLYDWRPVFAYFNKHPVLKSTFATKYPSRFTPEAYELDPEKHRLRISLMPQTYSSVLEPGTDPILKRVEMLTKLQSVLEVHINYSPIIYEDGWLEEYRDLFKLVHSTGIDTQCECIFLTHNEKQHARNSEEVQGLLWKPDIQEKKDSEYAADNIRYKWRLKQKMINQFVELYSEFFNPENIRYIF
jgi:spore photoproduct lyase